MNYKYAKEVLVSEGIYEFAKKSGSKIKNTISNKYVPTRPVYKIQSMVDKVDLYEANWSEKKFDNKAVSFGKNDKNITIGWVMSPPGRGSGGHQNLFRFIDFLEKDGYKSKIYLYSTGAKTSISTIQKNISQGFPKLKATMRWIKNGQEIPEYDVLFATGWETAYPVFNAKSKKKLYFVQDFEPFFFPVGSEYTLANNTYRFGFTGITAGKWLSWKLSNEYGMEASHFDFATNNKMYARLNDQRRQDVLFYARPVTPRRSFEAGVYSLELFKRMNPKSTIHMVGWDVSKYKLPFKYVNHGTLKLEELNELYNKCAAGLVLSLTNMSLLPLELLSSGTIPVVNEGQNNRMVSDNPYIHYTEPDIVQIAKSLDYEVNRKDQVSNSKKAAESVENLSWDVSGEQFIKAFKKAIY